MATQTANAAVDLGGVRAVERLEDVQGDYDVILCDVWGVVHNGLEVFPRALATLSAARKQGVQVVLLTNSPRPRGGVVRQLDGLGFTPAAYDAIVTSGDATRALIAASKGPVHHVGPERDVDIFAGLSTERVAFEEASALVVTGLLDDEAETPEAYHALLQAAKARELPLICANPDVVVHRGAKLVFCAGAIARDYESLGGRVLYAGKPYAPIYDLALEIAGSPERSRVLCIGDGLPTDIRGAFDNGFDALFITGGIHGGDMAGFFSQEIEGVLRGHGLRARYHMPGLT